MLSLQGKLDVYTFDPDDAKRVLQRNGKFGSTYLGKDSSGKDVVIKKAHPLKNDSVELIRFKREAEINAYSPNLVSVLEYFMQDNEHYIVREYLPGLDLKTYWKQKPLSWNDCIDIGLGVGVGLAGLHSKGIVHRDIRPGNIIVHDLKTTWVKLIDVGLAKLPGDDPDEKNPFALIYSPPEQIMNCNEAVNLTSDIYSLAITLYECLTGAPPFHHDNPEMMMHLMITKPLEPNKRIPKELFEVLAKASSKYKFTLPPNKYKKEELQKRILEGQKDRYKDAQEFVAALVRARQEINNKPVPFWKRIFK